MRSVVQRRLTFVCLHTEPQEAFSCQTSQGNYPSKQLATRMGLASGDAFVPALLISEEKQRECHLCGSPGWQTCKPRPRSCEIISRGIPGSMGSSLLSYKAMIIFTFT